MSEDSYPEGYTIGIFLPKEAPKETVDTFRHKLAELVYGELLEDRGNWDPAIIEHPRDIFWIDKQACECCPKHIYLSTSCFHGDHNYCKRETGLLGIKTPAVCKFCKAPCICKCHSEEGTESERGSVCSPSSPCAPTSS